MLTATQTNDYVNCVFIYMYLSMYLYTHTHMHTSLFLAFLVPFKTFLVFF